MVTHPPPPRKHLLPGYFCAEGLPHLHKMHLPCIDYPKLPLDNMGYSPYNRIYPIKRTVTLVQEYEVLFYDKADGSEPAKEFILGLDRAKRYRSEFLSRKEN